MVDVKNGGIRKDLSLLFATDSLPLGYNEEPIFSYDSAEGPYWNYAQRYHNIYKKIRNDGGRNYLNTSDFWDDAELNPDPSEVKYSDLPIPVLARMQVIFTLHKQRNTWNGAYNDQIYDPATIVILLVALVRPWCYKRSRWRPKGQAAQAVGWRPWWSKRSGGGPGGPGGGNTCTPRVNLFSEWSLSGVLRLQR